MWKKKYYKKSKRRRSIKSSKLEKKFEWILKELGIEYKTQFRVGYKFYDFYLPKTNTLIEVDGDYWHGNRKKFTKLSEMQKKNHINDLYKTSLAEASGYKLFRFWESDINTNPLAVKNKLLELKGT